MLKLEWNTGPTPWDRGTITIDIQTGEEPYKARSREVVALIESLPDWLINSIKTTLGATGDR